MIEEETIASAENVETAHVRPIKALNAKRPRHMDLGEKDTSEDIQYRRNSGLSNDENSGTGG